MILTEEQFKDIKEYTLSCHPNEMCGIISDGIFIPVDNIHEEPEDNFTLNPVQIAPYFGKIDAIIHSHTRDIKAHEVFDLRTPSYADIQGQKKTNVPWLIVGTEGYNVTEPLVIPRVRNEDYLERPFIWYMNDCYSLVQDYYWFELGIDLPDHKAEKDFANIRRRDGLFDDYIQEYGFEEFNPFNVELEKGDILLLDNGGYTRNHLGIYSGDGYVIHQDMLSRIEPVENFAYRIHKVLRYVNKSI